MSMKSFQHPADEMIVDDALIPRDTGGGNPLPAGSSKRTRPINSCYRTILARHRSLSRKTPGHAALRDFEAEQRAVDARRTPSQVLQRHPMYQCAEAGIDRRSTSTATLREPGPIAPKTGSVPADHGAGFTKTSTSDHRNQSRRRTSQNSRSAATMRGR